MYDLPSLPHTGLMAAGQLLPASVQRAAAAAHSRMGVAAAGEAAGTARVGRAAAQGALACVGAPLCVVSSHWQQQQQQQTASFTPHKLHDAMVAVCCCYINHCSSAHLLRAAAPPQEVAQRACAAAQHATAARAAAADQSPLTWLQRQWCCITRISSDAAGPAILEGTSAPPRSSCFFCSLASSPPDGCFISVVQVDI